MSEANKAAVRQLLDEGFHRGHLAALDGLVAADFVDHSNQYRGVAGLRQSILILCRAFPDLHITLHDVVSNGDRVVTRWTLTGTHQGELMGLPPTGRRVTLTGMDIYRFAGGKVAEVWGVQDEWGLMHQLGVVRG